MGLFDIFKKNKDQPTPIKYGEFTLTCKTDAESVIQRITNGTVNIASGIYNNGLFTVLDTTIVTDICNSWDWRFNKAMIPVIATAFGDLFLFCKTDQQIYFFQTQYNTMEAIADTFDELLGKAFPFPSIKQNVLKELRLQELKSICGELKYGKVYILKPWEMLGGVDKIENYTVGGLCVYHNLVSQTVKERNT